MGEGRDQLCGSIELFNSSKKMTRRGRYVQRGLVSSSIANSRSSQMSQLHTHTTGTTSIASLTGHLAGHTYGTPTSPPPLAPPTPALLTLAQPTTTGARCGPNGARPHSLPWRGISSPLSPPPSLETAPPWRHVLLVTIRTMATTTTNLPSSWPSRLPLRRGSYRIPPRIAVIGASSGLGLARHVQRRWTSVPPARPLPLLFGEHNCDDNTFDMDVTSLPSPPSPPSPSFPPPPPSSSLAPTMLLIFSIILIISPPSEASSPPPLPSPSSLPIPPPPGPPPSKDSWDDAPPAPSSPRTQQHPRGLVRSGGRRRTQGDIAQRRPQPGGYLGE